MRERAVAFIRFHYHPVALTETRVGAVFIDDAAIDAAISSFQTRERRFGRTSEQLPAEQQRG